ncbi:MAG: Nif11-like leader peptide family natural product precursor [Cyanobacteria bacterium M_surface_10_m1_298]|nr:Nif11-like leader peptide family natural product precursor [Cyanobacteria bacterium M_surface_10_m1_298]
MTTVHLMTTVSAADLKAFLSKVGNNEAIRSRIHAATGVNDILDIASSHGFNLSKPAVIRAHAEALSQASDHQLERVNTWGDALMHCFGATEAD